MPPHSVQRLASNRTDLRKRGTGKVHCACVSSIVKAVVQPLAPAASNGHCTCRSGMLCWSAMAVQLTDCAGRSTPGGMQSWHWLCPSTFPYWSAVADRQCFWYSPGLYCHWLQESPCATDWGPVSASSFWHWNLCRHQLDMMVFGFATYNSRVIPAALFYLNPAPRPGSASHSHM
jgi:hypothetical protein